MFEGQLGKDMMIEQGYVPATCTLDPASAGPIIYSEINQGRSPCSGCNADRAICKGQPKKPEEKTSKKKAKCGTNSRFAAYLRGDSDVN